MLHRKGVSIHFICKHDFRFKSVWDCQRTLIRMFNAALNSSISPSEDKFLCRCFDTYLNKRHVIKKQAKNYLTWRKTFDKDVPVQTAVPQALIDVVSEKIFEKGNNWVKLNKFASHIRNQILDFAKVLIRIVFYQRRLTYRFLHIPSLQLTTVSVIFLFRPEKIVKIFPHFRKLQN